MGKKSRLKKSRLDGKSIKRPAPEEKGILSILTGRYGFAVAIVLITVTALIIYSNVFSSPFYLDDEYNIVENYNLRDLSNFWPPSGTRYISFLSFAINYHFNGLDVFGYHLVNVIIHIMNGFLVWSLVVLTFNTPLMKRTSVNAQLKYFMALTSALIFISHPVQTQAITYVTQRFASLATLFYLLALVLFIKWRLSTNFKPFKSRRTFYILSLLFAVLAMKTKEISFTLPSIIILYEFMFFSSPELDYKETCYSRSRLLYLAPFLLTLTIIPFSLFSPELGLGGRSFDVAEKLREVQIRDLTTLSSHVYLMTQLMVLVTYIRLLFLPVNQNLDYDYPIYHSLFEPRVFLSFLFLLSIICLAVYLFARSHKTANGHGLLISFGILWFFITLSVESSIIPIGDVIFEHRLYLPLVGMVIAFTSFAFYGFDYAEKRLRVKVPTFVTACVLLLVTSVPLSSAAHTRNRVWKERLTLWWDVVSKSPDKARPRTYLGLAYTEQGRIDEAIEQYRSAIRLKPDYPEAHNNLGNAFFNQGRIDEAIEKYRSAIRLKPGFADAHNNLGLAHVEQGRIDEAIEQYHLAIRLKPHFSDALINLGLAYTNQRRTAEAMEQFRLAIRLKPNSAEAHNNLGNVYAAKGMLDEAIGRFKNAIRLKPLNVDAHYNLGLACKKKGLKKEAIRAFKAVLRLNPRDEEAGNILHRLLAKDG
jgi:tetratricopeptide (TPR) repeat protein